MNPLPKRVDTAPLAYTRQEAETLANYNAEISRGLVHTAEFDARMAEIQERYDLWQTGWRTDGKP